MQNYRDEFPERVKSVLRKRAGDKCSNISCDCSTSGPNHDPEKATSIGVAAHITAAAKNGPRYDSFLSSEERKSILNAIWLCQNCSKLVDSDPEIYPVNLLSHWKTQSEEMARLKLEGKQISNIKEKYDGYICPFCNTSCEQGVLVCIGCNADIHYKSTPDEWNQDNLGGFSLSLLFCLVFFVALPEMINQKYDMNFSQFWGLTGFSAFFISLIISLCIGIFVANIKNQKKLNSSPIFIRQRI